MLKCSAMLLHVSSCWQHACSILGSCVNIGSGLQFTIPGALVCPGFNFISKKKKCSIVKFRMLKVNVILSSCEASLIIRSGVMYGILKNLHKLLGEKGP